MKERIPIVSKPKEHLNPKVKPIFVCQTSEEEFEASGDILSISPTAHNIEYGKINADRENFLQSTIMMPDGEKSRCIISPIDGEDKISKGFFRCTSLVVAGVDKKTGENISFLSHQDPNNEQLGDFPANLRRRMAEMKERCVPGTIDAVLVGGAYSDAEDPEWRQLIRKRYTDSIKFLSKEVEEGLGFEPKIVSPKQNEFYRDGVYYKTADRNMYLVGPRISPRAGDFVASDLKKVKRDWEKDKKANSESPHPQAETVRTKARELLDRLRLGRSIENPTEIAIVVAHQDDESIAFGSLIPRMAPCLMVHVTDGAPIDPKVWRGAETRDQYAQIRERESDIALDRAGHTGDREVLGSMDQESVLRLAENTQRLAELLEKKGIKIVMTHSYEGGHPDHDSAAFIVHAAKELMKKRGLDLEIVEAPLYRMVGDQLTAQNFAPRSGTETVEIPLTKEEVFRKSMLYDAHRSQEEVFSQESETMTMSTEKELLREAPAYDFARAPNDGNLSHIFTDAGLTKERWETLTTKALEELGIKQ